MYDQNFNKLKPKSKLLACVASIALVTPFGGVLAQEQEEVITDQIVVTATGREQNIQDIPVAVTAIGGEEIKARGIYDLIDLAQVAPSLSTEASAGVRFTTLYVRGIGTTALNPGFEGAVGTFIDGVYRSRSGHANSDLSDVNRVEVLRGPQGTLFGKNTSAGVINIITNKPEFDFSGGTRLSVGNYNLFRSESFVTGPITDELAFRISATTNNRGGVVEDINTGDNYNDRNRWSAKGQLLWEPNDDLDLRLIGDYRYADESCCVAVFDEVPAGFTSGVLAGALGAYQPVGVEDHASLNIGAYNTAPTEAVEDYGLSLEANWETDLGKLTSITAFRRNVLDGAVDPDHSDADILAPLAEFERYNTFTQEVRFSGAFGKLDWLIGGFFFDESLRRGSDLGYASQTGQYVSILSPAFQLGPVDPSLFGPQIAAAERSQQDSDGWAFFTHNIVDVTDRLTLTLGARYLKENKEATVIVNDAPIDSFVNQPLCGTVFAIVALDVVCGNVSWNQQRSEDAVTGTAALSYAITDNHNLYASYSRGYKAGGFNLDRQGVQSIPTQGGAIVDSAQFEEEEADSYEIGLKSVIGDDFGTVNVALFYTDFSGYQLFNFSDDGLRFFVDNLDKVVSKGVEVETSFDIAEGVNIYGGATYSQTEFGKDLTPSNIVFPGEQVLSAPKWQGSAGFAVDRQILPGARGLANVNVFFQGPTILDRTPAVQDLYAVVNAQVGIANLDDTLRVSFWVRNAFDEFAAFRRIATPFEFGNFSAYGIDPRTFGATLETRF